MRNIKVYTSQFRYSGEDRFDITVKSGNKAFAPTWNMVMGVKNGTITEEKYTVDYLDQMRKSIMWNKEEWGKLLTKERIVLVCYCAKDVFCHRVLLAKFLEDNFEDVEYMGEIIRSENLK